MNFEKPPTMPQEDAGAKEPLLDLTNAGPKEEILDLTKVDTRAEEPLSLANSSEIVKGELVPDIDVDRIETFEPDGSITVEKAA